MDFVKRDLIINYLAEPRKKMIKQKSVENINNERKVLSDSLNLSANFKYQRP